jgi:hypothetical protein
MDCRLTTARRTIQLETVAVRHDFHLVTGKGPAAHFANALIVE